MGFYGVAHDRLPRIVDSETVRATVSASFVPTEADRPIGVWCVPPVTTPAYRNRNPLQPRVNSTWSGAKSTRNSGQSKKP